MAQIIPLEKVTVATAGTPVQLTTEDGVHAWAIRASEGNTGKVYLGLEGMDPSDYTGVFWELEPGETFNSATSGLNDINPSKIYLDAQAGGDGNFITGVLQIR